MSFIFSQSLLDDLPSSYSQEDSNSQDSGYAVQSSLAPPYVASNPRLPFPPKRKIPRPASWANMSQVQSAHNRWKFGGKKQWDRGDLHTNHLERDLQQHLTELLSQVKLVPGKISTIVAESVKFLENIYDKNYRRMEIDHVMEILEKLKEEVQSSDIISEGTKNKLEVLTCQTKECVAAMEKVAEKNKIIEAKLQTIQEKIDITEDLSVVLANEGSILKEKVKNLNMVTMVSDIVRQEVNKTSRHKEQSTPPPKLMSNSLKPLPSIRKLPTLPISFSARSSAVKSKGELRRCAVVEQIGIEDISRKVRGGELGGKHKNMITVGREKRRLNVVAMDFE